MRNLGLGGLSAAGVAEDQRRRIGTALCEVVSRRGYDAATVEQIIGPAGVSRRTFYDFFSGKSDAFRTTHGESLVLLEAHVHQACNAEPDWPREASAAISAALEWAVAEPYRARLVVADPLMAGSHFAYCHDRLVACFAPALRRGWGAVGSEASPMQEEALLAGFAAIVAARLTRGEAASLPALAPQLTEFVLAPSLGPAQAQRVA
jgi:AcrR family transcriptional regulator